MDLSAHLFEQINPQRALQICYLNAGGGLTDVQLLRRAREAASLRHGDKNPQLVQVHPLLRVIRDARGAACPSVRSVAARTATDGGSYLAWYNDRAHAYSTHASSEGR